MSSKEATSLQKFVGRVNSVALPMAISGLLNFRIYHYDRSVDPARPEYDEHVIFAFWHEYICLVLPRWGHVPLTVLCSQHRDGEWVNQTAMSLGLNIVRGSTTRGGSSAIRALKKNSKFSSIAVTPDGPRGPRRQMALGAIYMASLLKMPVVPVGVGMDNPWRLNTWDKFAIMRPFTRCRMIFGPKIYVPAKSKRDQLESIKDTVQQQITTLSDHAEEWAVSGKRIEGEQPFVRARRTNRLTFEPKKPFVAPLKLFDPPRRVA